MKRVLSWIKYFFRALFSRRPIVHWNKTVWFSKGSRKKEGAELSDVVVFIDPDGHVVGDTGIYINTSDKNIMWIIKAHDE